MKLLPLGLWPFRNPHQSICDSSGMGPFKTPFSTLRGEGEPDSPADNPHPSGATLHHLQAELHDLTDHALHQLMEDLQQKITVCELNAPPTSPSPMPWGNPSGSGNSNGDDQEVTFPRGGGWVPPGQPSPFHLPLGCNTCQPHSGW